MTNKLGSTAYMGPGIQNNTELRTPEKPVLQVPKDVEKESSEQDPVTRDFEIGDINQTVEEGKTKKGEGITPQNISAQQNFVDNGQLSGTFGLPHDLLVRKSGGKFSLDITEASRD
jgi:hypothetical protein